jgi:hypothetical protein
MQINKEISSSTEEYSYHKVVEVPRKRTNGTTGSFGSKPILLSKPSIAL